MLTLNRYLVWTVLALNLLWVSALSTDGAAQSASAPAVFRIGTASKAGTFYPIGTLLAKGITGDSDCKSAECGVPGLMTIAQVSNGSVANVEAVSSGLIEAGLAQADVIYWAYSAEGRFADSAPRTGLRAIANLYPGSLHIVTTADSDIRHVEDLRGKRVALDEPGSGTLATAELILASVGISKDELSPLYIKHNHAAPMLAKGQLDAFFFVAGYPTGSVNGLAKTTDIRLIPLSARTIERLSTERPYLARGVIPANTYKGITEDVPTLDIGTQLIVRADQDAGLIHKITAAIWSDHTRGLLDKGHPKGSQVQLETALKGIAIPLHEGAARFYREVGRLKE